jgi:hypothetical protein
LAAVTSPAVAAQTAWIDTAEVKGCDGNWYWIERPYSMRQCLENGRALHCSPEQAQQSYWRDFGAQQQNGGGG